MDNRQLFLEKAEALKPRLHVQTMCPVSGLPVAALSEGDSVVLDFWNHFVGQFSMKLSSRGSHPDAPAWLRFKFCENARELDETLEGYQGWISKSWVQTEEAHVDVLPAIVSLPRRYAFRYVRIDVLALSSKYRLTIEDAWAETTTSADDAAVTPYSGDERDCAKSAMELCERLCVENPEGLESMLERRRAAMREVWFDPARGVFVSGANRQVSWATQVWAVLAGVVEGEDAANCLEVVKSIPEAVGMVTPYMMHHYVEALCLVGRRAEARQVMRDYWGAMVDLGADTFWELFNPKDPNESPYGSPVVNSYCHAWSCTPTWFLRSGFIT